MKKNLLHTASPANSIRFTALLIAAIFIGLQLCPVAGKSQVAYWLTSLPAGVKKQLVTAPPASAGSATTLASQTIPLYIFEDDRNGFIYWSDAGSGSIRRVSTAGGSVTEVVTGITGTGVYARGIALDIANNQLYWAQTGPGTGDVVKSISLAGALPKTGISGSTIVTGINIIRGMALDTLTGYVYFADAGSLGAGRGIYKASVSATSTEATSTKVVSLAAGTQPNSLFIDNTNNYIYWCDWSPAGKIFRAAINAASFPAAQTNVYTGTESIRGMSVDPAKNTIYWTQYPSLTIQKASLASIPVVNPTVLITGLTGLPRNLSVRIDTCKTYVTPSVTVTANVPSPICAKTNVTFTATPVNGGVPVYEWHKNNSIVGTNSNTYSDSLLNTYDSVWCDITSNYLCTKIQKVKSNVLVYTVNPVVKPGASISADIASPICNNTKVTFTATATYGGSPAYEWHKNRRIVGTNSSTYVDSLLKSNDTVWCNITSSVPCATPAKVKSNVLVYTVNAAIPAQPSAITGPTSVNYNQTYGYRVTKVAGVTYNWTVPYGVTLVKGQGTDTITVTWGPYSGTLSVTAGNGCGASSPSSVFVNVVSGLLGGKQPESGKGKISLSPNPASAASTLNLSGFKSGAIVTVTDMAGHIVWQQNKLVNGSYTLPVAKLAQGVYMVTVKDRFSVQTVKLVKAPITQ